MSVGALRGALGFKQRNAKGDGPTDRKSLIEQYVEKQLQGNSSGDAKFHYIFSDIVESTIIGADAVAAIESANICDHDFMLLAGAEAAFISELMAFLTWSMQRLHHTEGGALRDVGVLHTKRASAQKASSGPKKIYVDLGKHVGEGAVTLHFVGNVRAALAHSSDSGNGEARCPKGSLPLGRLFVKATKMAFDLLVKAPENSEYLSPAWHVRAVGQ